MSHPSSSRYPRQRSSGRTSESSSTSNSSSVHRGSLQTRRFLETIASEASHPYESPYSPIPQSNQYLTVPVLQQSPITPGASVSRAPTATPMSAYSSASDQSSIYSSPGPQDYQVVTSNMITNPKNLSKVSLPLHELVLSAAASHMSYIFASMILCSGTVVSVPEHWRIANREPLLTNPPHLFFLNPVRRHRASNLTFNCMNTATCFTHHFHRSQHQLIATPLPRNRQTKTVSFAPFAPIASIPSPNSAASNASSPPSMPRTPRSR